MRVPRWRSRTDVCCEHWLYLAFDNAEPGMQFVETVPWIAAFNVWYYLGVDGMSAPLILLTTFITPLVVIAGWDSIKNRPAQYFAAFLILEGLMIGVFCCARRAAVLYIRGNYGGMTQVTVLASGVGPETGIFADRVVKEIHVQHVQCLVHAPCRNEARSCVSVRAVASIFNG